MKTCKRMTIIFAVCIVAVAFIASFLLIQIKDPSLIHRRGIFYYGCLDEDNRLKCMHLGNEYHLNTIVKSG